MEVKKELRQHCIVIWLDKDACDNITDCLGQCDTAIGSGYRRRATLKTSQLQIPMYRWFNTADPCKADVHYMPPPTIRLPKLERIIAQESPVCHSRPAPNG